MFSLVYKLVTFRTDRSTVTDHTSSTDLIEIEQEKLSYRWQTALHICYFFFFFSS